MIPMPPLLSSADAVEDAFYDAMRRGDLAAMMSLWSDDEEVVCIHPGGPRLVGLDAVRASWEAILSGGPVDIQFGEVRATHGAMLCVHSVVETIRVQGRRGGETVRCAATNVYTKGPRGWRLLIHHAGPADTAESQPAAPSGALLH